MNNLDVLSIILSVIGIIFIIGLVVAFIIFFYVFKKIKNEHIDEIQRRERIKSNLADLMKKNKNLY